MKGLNYFFYVLLIVFCSCGSDKQNSDVNNKKPANLKAHYIEDIELEVMRNRQKYLWHDIVTERKDWKLSSDIYDRLESYYKEFTDKEANEVDECRLLNVNEVIELYESTNRPDYLKSKGLHLYEVSTRAGNTIENAKDLRSVDFVYYGRCRGGQKYNPWNRNNYKETRIFRFRLGVVLNSEGQIHISIPNISLKMPVITDIKTNGEKVVFRPFNLNEKENIWEEVYIYKNYKWTFEPESAAQIERMTNKEYENSTRLIVEKIDEEDIEAKATAPSYFVLTDKKVETECSYFNDLKLYDVLGWEQSEVEVGIKDWGGRLTKEHSFVNFQKGNILSVIHSEIDLSTKDTKNTLSDAYKQAAVGDEFTDVSGKARRPILLKKSYNSFGRNKWMFLIKKMLDDTHEVILLSLSENEQNPELVNTLKSIGKHFEK